MPAPYRESLSDDGGDTTYDTDEFTNELEIKSDSEDYASEFEMIEESVESVPVMEEQQRSVQVLLRQHSSMMMSGGGTTVPAAATATSSRSSLPSLPSINNMSGGLTVAGRAHFAQASLFGAKSLPSATVPPATSAASPTATPAALTPEQLQAYRTANQLCAAESLGIVAIVVPQSSDPSATPTFVHVDDNKLMLWCGLVQTDVSGGSSSSHSQSGVYLRAGIGMTEQDVMEGKNSTDASKFMHLFLDSSSSPSAANIGSASNANDPTSDGTSNSFDSFKLSSCYGLKTLAHYRLRVLSIESSLPQQADSYERFKEKSCRIGDGLEEAESENVGGEASDSNTNAVASPFDIEPIKTVYVAIEKILVDDETTINSSSSSTAASSHDPSTATSIPLLPLNTSHIFWLSTHHSSLTSKLVFAASSSSSSATDSTDSFELQLDLVPLTLDVLKEFDVKEVEVEAEPRGTRSSVKKANRRRSTKKTTAVGAPAAATSSTSSSSSSSAVPPLVSVLIEPAASTSVDESTLVALNFLPATTTASDLAATSSSAAPSLEDVLATLAISPSTALPSSILHNNQSMVQLAELTSDVMNHNIATSSSSGATSASSPTPATTTVNHHLTSLDHRQAWPYTVELSAMRLSDEIEGHCSAFESIDLIHNRPLPTNKNARRASARRNVTPKLKTVLVGDHEITLLRTVGLTCSWAHPRDASELNQPVLVSQTPLISYHVQLCIKRIDADEAREREMNQMLGVE